MIETGKTYLLRLSGGHEWDLMATADEARLVERIASVMELKEGASGNAPRIIVRRGGSREKNGGVPLDRLEPRMREGLPREGWRAWNSGEFLVWFNAETEDAVFHTLGDTKNRQEYQRVRLFLFPVCRKVILSGGMTVHAALAERGGAGVIMAGQSQKGKSTACRRLTPPWRVLGDEEALVIRDHEGGYFAHPFPTWSDIYGRKLKKSWDVQCSVPMSAIFFLEQADRVAVEPIGKAEAAVRLCHLAEEKTATGWWCVGYILPGAG